MQTTADAPTLLDLLREAGDEAVTLSELAVAGVPDPAAQLLALELEGMRVQRVYESTSGALCLRLAPEVVTPEVEQLDSALLDPPTFDFPAIVASRAARETAQEPAPAPATAPATPRHSRSVVMALLGAVVVLLLALRR